MNETSHYSKPEMALRSALGVAADDDSVEVSTADLRDVIVEHDRRGKVEQEVAGLAAEWERFGLQGAAQRLRHILGEVTS